MKSVQHQSNYSLSACKLSIGALELIGRGLACNNLTLSINHCPKTTWYWH